MINQALDLLITGIALLYTIVSHELAHGYIALLNGDDTAKRAGRLTLNPISHIDPMGLICLIILRFGWAKPVPIDPRKFHNRVSGMLTVSLAGVSVNLISAAIAVFLFRYAPNKWVFDLLQQIAIYGVAFCVFNLLPIPPLDGSKVIAAFLSPKARFTFFRYERYGSYILLALAVSGVIGTVISPIIQQILRGLFRLFHYM